MGIRKLFGKEQPKYIETPRMIPKSTPHKDIFLLVIDALDEDANKGMVRMNATAMLEADLNSGDFIEIEGEDGKLTKAVVYTNPVENKDEKYCIRLDRNTRYNSKASIGSEVRVRKVTPNFAKEVLISPGFSQSFKEKDLIELKRNLLGRPLMRNDIVSIPKMKLFPENSGKYDMIRFTIKKTDPTGVVIVNNETNFQLY